MSKLTERAVDAGVSPNKTPLSSGSEYNTQYKIHPSSPPVAMVKEGVLVSRDTKLSCCQP